MSKFLFYISLPFLFSCAVLTFYTRPDRATTPVVDLPVDIPSKTNYLPNPMVNTYLRIAIEEMKTKGVVVNNNPKI